MSVSATSLRHDMLHQNRMRRNIASVLHRLFDRLKRFMRRKHQTVGIIDQRISRNPRLRLVGLGESAVNNEQLPAAFYRGLSRFASTGIWPLMICASAPSSPNSERDAVDHLFLLQQAVVRVLRLLVRCCVCDKIALKRRHFCFSKHRGNSGFPR